MFLCCHCSSSPSSSRHSSIPWRGISPGNQQTKRTDYQLQLELGYILIYIYIKCIYTLVGGIWRVSHHEKGIESGYVPTSERNASHYDAAVGSWIPALFLNGGQATPFGLATETSKNSLISAMAIQPILYTVQQLAIFSIVIDHD